MTKHHIYWWNLENLFDIENSPRRSEFLNNTLKGELEGWTVEVLDQKIGQLLSIITQFNKGKGPDIFGVCEVENAFVVELLLERMNQELSRDYAYVISDSADKRGIDSALIYDSAMYNPDPGTFSLRIIKRNPTRDLFQVHLNTTSGKKLLLVLNHWPSRSGGVLRTEPYRIMVAENLAYWIERMHEEQGDEASIVLMGDFNDNPTDRSLTDYLLAKNNRALVKSDRTTKKYMYNLMHRFQDAQLGTTVFSSQYNLLDQFIISKHILSEVEGVDFNLSTVKILNYPELTSGSYQKPIRFSRPNRDNYDPDGYSDHLPIELVLNEK